MVGQIAAYRRRMQADLPAKFQVEKLLPATTGLAVSQFAQSRQFSRAVEFESELGLLPAYVAAGLRSPGVCYVLEASSQRAAVAEETLTNLCPRNIDWEVVVGEPRQSAMTVLRNLRTVDYIRISGEGRCDPTVDAFEIALTAINPGGVIAGYFDGGKPLKTALQKIRQSTRIVREFKLGQLIAFEIN